MRTGAAAADGSPQQRLRLCSITFRMRRRRVGRRACFAQCLRVSIYDSLSLFALCECVCMLAMRVARTG